MKKISQTFHLPRLVLLVLVLLAGNYNSWAALSAATSPMPVYHMYFNASTASYYQTFTLTGTSLGAATSVSVTAPANFEVSKDNITYSTSLSYSVTAGTMAGSPAVVYVRVKANTTIGNYSAANVACATVPAALTANVSVSAQVYTTPGSFTAGNIAMMRIGYTSSAANIILLDEYTQTGVYVQTFITPFANGAYTPNGTSAVESGSASNDGGLSRSADGQYLVYGGYDGALGTASIANTTSAANPRAGILLKANGAFTLGTTTSQFSAASIRGNTSIDGSSIFLGGNGGCYSIATGTVNGAGTAITSGNLRGVNILNGQLYQMTSSAVGQILPTPTVTGLTVVPNTSATATTIPQSGANLFALLALDIDPNVPGNDVIYVADGTAGILKYTFDGTTWTAKGSYTGVCGGITGYYNAGGPSVTLFATSGTGGGNLIYKLTDNAPATSSLSGAITTGTLMATAFANTVYRGVALAPVLLSATPTVAVVTPAAVANNILLGSTNNVIYQMNLTAGSNPAVLTGLTITTAGTYNNAVDFAATNGFKIWISPSSTFSAATATPVGVFAPVASGATISTSILAQTIPASTARYIYFTADVLAGATVGNTISIIATPLSNIVLADAGTKTGSAGVGGVKTISPAPSISVTPSSLPNMFTYFGTSSGAQTYSLTGSYLTTNLNVTAPANFEVSQDGTNYFPSLSLVPSGGSVSVTVSVRIKATAPVGTYTSQLVSNASTGSTTQNVTVSGTVSTAPSTFTAGNIVLYRIGDGSAALSSSAQPTFIDEYPIAANATLAQTIAIPTGINGANRILTNSGTATSEGTLSRSVDGQYLVVAGYDVAPGTATVASTTSSTANRIVGSIAADGTVNTSTRIPDGFDQNNPRSATSIDGSAFWVTGAGALNSGGVRYINLGANTSSQLSTAPTNARVIGIYGNQLYVTSATSNVGLNTEGSGVSSSAGLVTTTITLPSNPTDAYGYVLLDRDVTVPGVDVLYIANNAGGLLKYSFDGTTWTARGSITGAVTAVTGVVNGANADLYVLVGTSSPSSLYKVTDAALFNANISGSGGAVSAVPGAVLIKTSPTNTIWKGVAFAPVQLPATPVVTFSSGGPVAGPVLQAETDHEIYELNASVTAANAVVTSLTFTTGGTYVVGDLFAGPSPFKLRYSSDNILDATDATIGTAAATASGGSLVFNIAQPISASVTGHFFVTVDLAGSATVGNTIRINSTPVSNITLADNATKLGSPVAGGFQTIFSSVIPTVFYSNGGNLDDLANWGDQTDGSVSIPAYAPVSFVHDGYTWKIANSISNTITNNWVVSGVNTKVVVQSTITFVIPAAYSFTISGAGAGVDVEANGTLEMLNTTIPTFGILDPASTEIFGATSAQSIPGSLSYSYGNLTLTGSGTKTVTGLFNSNPIEVKGDFTIDNTTVTSSLTGSQEQTIGLWGDLKILNGVTYLAGWNGFVNYETKGTANQIIYGNGFPVNCKKFYLNINNLSAATNLKPSGSVTLSNLSGGTNLVLASTLKLNCGNTTPANTATFVDNGQTITVAGDVEMAGSAANYTLTGTVVLTGASGTVNLRQDGGAGSALVLKANLKNLSIQTSGNTVTQVQPASGSATLNILGNFTIGGTSTGKFTPFGNVIKVGGNFTDSRTIDMIASGSSTFEFNGTAAQTFSTAYPAGESFFNVKINNASGVNMIAASNFKITSTGNLNMAVGILNTGTGIIVLNNTATISEPLNGSSFVQGRVQTTRILTSGTPETFGGLGIDVTPSLNATTTCARVIGNTSAIGCANSSTLRYFDFTASTVTSPTSVVYHYFDTNYEMNNFDEGDVSIFQSNTPYTTWTVVPLAQTVLDSNNNKLTLTGLTSLSRVTLSVAAPSGGNAIPAGGTAIARTTMICPNTSTTISISGFGQGTVQWQQSANGLTGWTSVTGGSGATSLTYTTPALNTTTFYRGLVSNSCFDIASTTATVFIAAPIVVTISNVTSNSALVSWTPYAANSNVNYTISWSGAGIGSQSNAISPRLITGLTSGQNLNVTVTQNTPAGCVNSGAANTTILCATTAAPTFGTIASQTMVVNIPAGGTYKVWYKQMFVSNTFLSSPCINGGATGSTYTITTAYPGSAMAIYLQACDCPTSGLNGQQGPQVIQYFSPGTSTCPTPTISVVSNCPNQFTATLGGNPANIYRITLRRISPSPSSANTYQITGTTFNYTVSPNQGGAYEVYAQSVCGTSYSVMTQLATVSIKPPCPAISNLVLSNKTCYGFTASWNPDNCGGLGVNYSVFVKVGTGNWNGYGASTNYLPMYWFNPSSSIQCYVRSNACNNAAGPASTIETVTLPATCRVELVTDSTSQFNFGTPDEVVSAELNIYPNPNSGMFKINYLSASTEDHNVRLEVMNMLGQTIQTDIVEINSGILNYSMNTNSELASGIYFVRVVDNDSRIEKKFIIQH